MEAKSPNKATDATVAICADENDAANVVGDGVVGDGVVGTGVGEGVGDWVGEGEGDGVGAGVVGEGVGEGVGVFGPVHVTGGLQFPVLRHAGHIAPSVQSGLGERCQRLSLMAQMPAPAPVIWLLYNVLRTCARKKCEGGRAW